MGDSDLICSSVARRDYDRSPFWLTAATTLSRKAALFHGCFFARWDEMLDDTTGAGPAFDSISGIGVSSILQYTTDPLVFATAVSANTPQVAPTSQHRDIRSGCAKGCRGGASEK